VSLVGALDAAVRNAALAVIVVVLGASACGGVRRGTPPPLADQVSNGDRDPRQALLAELQTDVLTGYERDEPPELGTDVVPVIGGARIGVGPGDVMVDQELANASSRWPLLIGSTTKTSVRTKRLERHLAADQSAAWVSDEVSWRVEVCDHTLVIPLRFTALYARDGDRWVLAIEHLSTGSPLPTEGALVGRSIPAAEASSEIGEALASAMAPLLQSPISAAPSISSGPEATLIGPQWAQEWHGADLLGQRIVDGTLTTEEGRAGVVGRTVDDATVAYWVGTLIATAASGARTRLRATFVFEKRATPAAEVAPATPAKLATPPSRAPPTWVVVQGHVSLPVDDETLARGAVGSALVGLNPLSVQCGDAVGAGAMR
jgi:hypothetical protein